MKQFAQLFTNLDQTNKTNDKVKILKDFFINSSDPDKIWALALFTHKRPRKQVNSTLLRRWAAEFAKVPDWLFDESYGVVGDLAETISLLLPFPENEQDEGLTWWMDFLLSLNNLEEHQKKEKILAAWNMMTQQERFVFIKLMTGSFRIGVSQGIVVRALSEVSGIEKNVLFHRLMGKWDPVESNYHDLVLLPNKDDDISKPYPFFLAHPIDSSPELLGNPLDWQAEWKWDGIRSQFIKRQNEIFIWSRGEDLITEKFPELHEIQNYIPDGTVIDGEILPFKEGQPLSFALLQTRIGRKNLTKKILLDAPVVIVAYDLLEWEGKDVRATSMKERRLLLEEIINNQKENKSLILSATVDFDSW
ncbi:MAG: ATP-dependent DNA ligase, partial [Bacteroidota bacterium]|nr:ATP-dependent DNA ligase [Bacteroidota bacterium]